MRLQAKFALYSAITKLAIILVLGAIILFSLEKIAYNHLDNRLKRKKSEVIASLNDKEIDSLLITQQTFTDYNILKDEFIVLKPANEADIKDNTLYFITEKRTIENDAEFFRILNYTFKYHDQLYKLELGETMTALESIKSTIQFYMLIVLVAALTITLITDYTFTNFILKPFYIIIDKKINKVNDLILYNYENVPTNTQDFRILDNSINALMRKISNLFVQEKQFIANVSHELLTPVSILSTRLENMLNTEGISIEHENKIYASLKTLSRLKVIINNLLLITKVENEQYLKTDTIQIPQELQDVFEELEDRVLDKNISYTSKLNHNFSFIGNRALFHTLLINLISNAIKYNVESGQIIIEDEFNKQGYTLKITDTGIGMESNVVNNAFNRFERGGNTSEEGLGLGLAIVQTIAKYHEIEVKILSEKGLGTTILLIFNSSTFLH